MRRILAALLCLSALSPLAARAAPVNTWGHGDWGRDGTGFNAHAGTGHGYAGRNAFGGSRYTGADQGRGYANGYHGFGAQRGGDHRWEGRGGWTGGRYAIGDGRRSYGRYDRDGRWIAYGLGGLALGAAIGSAYDGYGGGDYDGAYDDGAYAQGYDGGYGAGGYAYGGYDDGAGYVETAPTGYIGAYANGYSGDPYAAVDYAGAPAYAADAAYSDGYSYSYTREQTTESYGPVYASQCYSQITTWDPAYGQYVTRRLPAAC